MASAMPGDMSMHPNWRIALNGPFNEKKTYNVQLTNNGAHRIGWDIWKTTDDLVSVTPPCGVLDPKEACMLTIACEPIDDRTKIYSSFITFEWTNAPDGAAKQFRREWFQGDDIVLGENVLTKNLFVQLIHPPKQWGQQPWGQQPWGQQPWGQQPWN